MTELDDLTIRRAGRQDKAAFRALYDHYAPFVWKVVYRTVGADKDLAADVMQETFVRVHQSLKKFAHNSAFSTWLYRIAYNTSMTWLSRHSRHRADGAHEEDIAVGSGGDRLDARDLVNRLFATITAEERFLLTAREVTGLSFEELAEVSGSNAGALRVKLHRLKAELRQTMQEWEDARPTPVAAVAGGAYA